MGEDSVDTFTFVLSVETAMDDRRRQSLEELRQPLLSSADRSEDPYGEKASFNGYFVRK